MADTVTASRDGRAKRAPQHHRHGMSRRQVQAYLVARGALRRMMRASLLGSPPDVRVRRSPPAPSSPAADGL